MMRARPAVGRSVGGDMARGALLWVLLMVGTARAAEPGWDFVVTLPDAEVGAVDVDWTLRGFAGPVRVCGDMSRAFRGVARIEQLEPGQKRALPKDGECWMARAEKDKPLRLRYRYDLDGMAGQRGD